MDQPKIAATKPVVLELDPGRYAWCACGQSANQPFCDGSHAGTAFRPQMFEVAAPTKVAVCQCKRTAGAPFCDGSHKTLG
jgi:CDGSH-type Zn-finger protein